MWKPGYEPGNLLVVRSGKEIHLRNSEVLSDLIENLWIERPLALLNRAAAEPVCLDILHALDMLC